MRISKTRLWENFCGQSAFGKAVEHMNGGKLVGYTETDPYCRTHLGRTFPNAKGLKDHREARATARVNREVSLTPTLVLARRAGSEKSRQKPEFGHQVLIE